MVCTVHVAQPFFPAGWDVDSLPRRLLAINAIQLALALVANVFLLLNMARRVRFGIAQPITMLGW